MRIPARMLRQAKGGNHTGAVLSKHEAIEFAIIGGIAALCEVFVFVGLFVAMLVTGAIPWL